MITPDAPRARLHLKPCTISEAKRIVGKWHRHHRPPIAGLFAVACALDDGTVVGAAIVALPKARMLMDGVTAEVIRVATDGTPNACSVLYASAWRACRALGYKRLITYTLQSESGASLRGAGWRLVGAVESHRGWIHSKKMTAAMATGFPWKYEPPKQAKLRWEKTR